MKWLMCIVVTLPMSCGSSRPHAPAAAAPVTVAEATRAAPAAKETQRRPVIPDTAAGRTLAAWLDAFNGNDAARMKAFVERYKDPEELRIINNRERTGGFDLVSVEHSEPRSITFVVQERATATPTIGWLRVADGDPAQIESFTLVPIPHGKTAADIHPEIDSATTERIVDAAAKAVEAAYVYPALGKQMAQSIRQHLARGDDAAFTDGPDLAVALTKQLDEISHDRHVRVEWQAMAPPPGSSDETPEDETRMKREFEKMNCGFSKTERLAGNVGYIKLDVFGPADLCGASATAAYAALGDVDAVIFDLRDDGGGFPDMITYVESYLFAKRTHIYDMYNRLDNKATPIWTNPDVPGKKLPTQPVYVLTSARTFSGAEAFAYDLQTTKRATVVGEVTGGGAHPTGPVALDAHFVLMVPSSRPINAVTKTDWEGSGVKPDVSVPAAEALDKAQQLAADKLAKLRGARK